MYFLRVYTGSDDPVVYEFEEKNKVIHKFNEFCELYFKSMSPFSRVAIFHDNVIIFEVDNNEKKICM